MKSHLSQSLHYFIGAIGALAFVFGIYFYTTESITTNSSNNFSVNTLGPCIESDEVFSFEDKITGGLPLESTRYVTEYFGPTEDCLSTDSISLSQYDKVVNLIFTWQFIANYLLFAAPVLILTNLITRHANTRN